MLALVLLAATACSTNSTTQEAETATVTSSPTATTPPPATTEPPTEVPTPTPTPSPVATPTAPTEQAPDEPVELTTSDVATDLEAPWGVAFTPDGTAYVTERDTGRLLRMDAAGDVAEVQTFDIDPTGEGGLLGLAASPGFAEDGLLYAYLSTAEDNRIVRFRPGEEPETVLTGIPHGPIHNGGRIAFGPDGLLYAGTGDSGNASLAQNPESLGGKILRLTPDGGVPTDNPTAGSLVYTLGHRNVQGFAWTADGQLYATEYGPDRDDEINRIEAGGNYGWPEVTGRAQVGEFIDPIAVEQPPDASWSGATIPKESAIPQWNGQLIVASLRGERLWHFMLDDGGSEEVYVGEFGRLRLAVQAPDGSVWLLTSNRDGRGSPAPADDRIIRVGPAE